MVDPKATRKSSGAAEMKATLDDWIPKILAAQEPDGYLQTAYTLADAEPLERALVDRAHRGDHEGYVAGYFIESAINHYTMTDGKDKRLYNAAKKLADCWVANIGPGKKEWFDGHQEMEQALVRFGRFVNDMEGGGHGDNYVRLAKFLLDSRKGGSEYDQSHVPVHATIRSRRPCRAGDLHLFRHGGRGRGNARHRIIRARSCPFGTTW